MRGSLNGETFVAGPSRQCPQINATTQHATVVGLPLRSDAEEATIQWNSRSIREIQLPYILSLRTISIHVAKPESEYLP